MFLTLKGCGTNFPAWGSSIIGVYICSSNIIFIHLFPTKSVHIPPTANNGSPLSIFLSTLQGNMCYINRFLAVSTVVSWKCQERWVRSADIPLPSKMHSWDEYKYRQQKQVTAVQIMIRCILPIQWIVWECVR